MVRPKLRPKRLTPGILALSFGFAFQGSNAAEFTLMPSPQTVHIGNFNAANKPVLTIDSGDVVTVETAYAAIEPAEVDQSGVVPPRSAFPKFESYQAALSSLKDQV